MSCLFSGTRCQVIFTISNEKFHGNSHVNKAACNLILCFYKFPKLQMSGADYLSIICLTLNTSERDVSNMTHVGMKSLN